MSYKHRFFARVLFPGQPDAYYSQAKGHIYQSQFSFSPWTTFLGRNRDMWWKQVFDTTSQWVRFRCVCFTLTLWQCQSHRNERNWIHQESWDNPDSCQSRSFSRDLLSFRDLKQNIWYCTDLVLVRKPNYSVTVMELVTQLLDEIS